MKNIKKLIKVKLQQTSNISVVTKKNIYNVLNKYQLLFDRTLGTWKNESKDIKLSTSQTLSLKTMRR